MVLHEVLHVTWKKTNLQWSGVLKAPLTYGFNLSLNFECVKFVSINFPLKHVEELIKTFKRKTVTNCGRIYDWKTWMILTTYLLILYYLVNELQWYNALIRINTWGSAMRSAVHTSWIRFTELLLFSSEGTKHIGPLFLWYRCSLMWTSHRSSN